jgi:hypothetical protein
MVGAALSIKLRCASWQQLATIYRRDLSKGTMFLKASNQPPIGTLVRIDLELPSATVIELSGVIVQHVTDPQRGTGVDLKLEPLPTKSVWLIESALAAENKVRAQTGTGSNPVVTSSTGPVAAIAEGEDIAAAENDLIRALAAEADSLRKLNPFLVLGVGYETTDSDVRAAFGELTKRYHPDRFARYQSERLRQIAAEIFILIRDAYRKLADEGGRTQAVAAIGKQASNRAPSQPRSATPPMGRPTTGGVAKVPPAPPAKAIEPPTKPGPHDAPTNPSKATAELAHTELARADQLAAVPAAAPTPVRDLKSGPVRVVSTQTPPRGTPVVAIPPTAAAVEKAAADRKAATAPTGPMPDGSELSTVEALLDDGKLDEALAQYKLLVRKHPNDRGFRAGIELCEGLRALVARDRLEAAQRFETALEIDPSNERAARELADMRRQATNERKGLLSRLMGKKEPPP